MQIEKAAGGSRTIGDSQLGRQCVEKIVRHGGDIGDTFRVARFSLVNVLPESVGNMDRATGSLI